MGAALSSMVPSPAKDCATADVAIDQKAASAPATHTFRVTTSVDALRKGVTEMSDAVTVGGLQWCLYVDRDFEIDDLASPSSLVVGFTSTSSCTKWRARLQAHFIVTMPNGVIIENSESVGTIDCRMVLCETIMDWQDLEKLKSGEINVEATLTAVVEGLRKEPETLDYTQPDRRFDTVLVIEGKKVYASKSALALQSHYFNRVFYGPEAVEAKSEYALDDCCYEDFMRLLSQLHTSSGCALTDDNIDSLLTIAAKYECENIVVECEKHLLYSATVPLSKRLALADQFSLVTLEDECLHEITSTHAGRDVVTWEGFGELSVRLQNAIYHRTLFSNVVSDGEDEEWEEGSEDSTSTEDDDEEEEEYTSDEDEEGDVEGEEEGASGDELD